MVTAPKLTISADTVDCQNISFHGTDDSMGHPVDQLDAGLLKIW